MPPRSQSYPVAARYVWRMADRVAKPEWFTRVTFYSVLAALCPLVPVPFLDAELLKRVKRRLVGELSRERGYELSDHRVAVLAGTKAPLRPFGCLFGVVLGGALKLVVFVVKRVFRKIIYLLAVKEAVDVASHTFHQGYLVHWALLRDDAHVLLSDGAAGKDEDGARRIDAAIEAACKGMDTRPVNQVLRRTFRAGRTVLLRAAAPLTGGGKLPAHQGALGGLAADLAADLWEREGYLSALEARFDEALLASAAAHSKSP